MMGSLELLGLVLGFNKGEIDMIVDYTEAKCGQCGSGNIENFRRGNIAEGCVGRRCLDCGHERVNSWGPLGVRSGQQLEYENNPPVFF